jgi:hypothetical protein
VTTEQPVITVNGANEVVTIEFGGQVIWQQYKRSTAQCLEDALNDEKRRYAEGLEAWKKNSEWHAARIFELESALRAVSGAALKALNPT